LIGINSDLGELAGNDDEILRHIDSANVCCGVHAGSPTVSLQTVRLCAKLGVEVGAHPGYDDRENFGRIEVALSAEDIGALVAFQVAAMAAIAPITYIKVHGAMYHRCAADPEAARAVAEVAARHGIGVMGQPGRLMIEAAQQAGVPAYREGYADRLYQADGSLAPRTQPGSVLRPKEAAEQALRLARSGDVDTICIHGDSPGAGDAARLVKAALQAAGITTGPLAPA
jgi:UPF0271 protein